MFQVLTTYWNLSLQNLSQITFQSQKILKLLRGTLIDVQHARKYNIF